MFRIVPQLTVNNVTESVKFYEECLGFTMTVLDPPEEPVFASLERDDATLFLVTAGSREEETQLRDLARNKRGVGVRLYLEVDDARVVYEELMASGIAPLRELAYNESEDYTEFSIQDPDGYEIGVYS